MRLLMGAVLLLAAALVLGGERGAGGGLAARADPGRGPEAAADVGLLRSPLASGMLVMGGPVGGDTCRGSRGAGMAPSTYKEGRVLDDV